MSGQVAVFDADTDMVVVYDGPRGQTGPDGPVGPVGPKGDGFVARGDWQNNLAYTENDTVVATSSVNANIDSLWIVREGQTPTVGVEPKDEPSAWMEVGSPRTTDGLGPVWEVTQLAHPFTMVGQPATFNPGTGSYELADARYPERLMYGVVLDIPDANTVVFQAAGELAYVDPFVIYDPATAAGRSDADWVPGQIYYLSSAPGMIQVEKPSAAGWIDQPVLVPTETNGDGTTRAVIIPWGPGGGGGGGLNNDNSGAHEGEVSPPPNPSIGDLWFRQDDYPGIYIYLEGPNGDYWVQANG